MTRKLSTLGPWEGMNPTKYKKLTKYLDDIVKAFPEHKDECGKIQNMAEAHIFKKIGPVYHNMYKIMRSIYDKHAKIERDFRETVKTEERQREEEMVRKNPGHKYNEDDIVERYLYRVWPSKNRPEISWIANSVLELLNDIVHKEAWYHKGPKDD